jgi:hypothetical protein
LVVVIRTHFPIVSFGDGGVGFDWFSGGCGGVVWEQEERESSLSNHKELNTPMNGGFRSIVWSERHTTRDIRINTYIEASALDDKSPEHEA